MFNSEKKSNFATIGELRVLLADFPDNTPVYVCGLPNSYLHVDEDDRFVSFDDDPLYYAYPQEEEFD